MSFQPTTPHEIAQPISRTLLSCLPPTPSHRAPLDTKSFSFLGFKFKLAAGHSLGGRVTRLQVCPLVNWEKVLSPELQLQAGYPPLLSGDSVPGLSDECDEWSKPDSSDPDFTAGSRLLVWLEGATFANANKGTVVLGRETAALVRSDRVRVVLKLDGIGGAFTLWPPLGPPIHLQVAGSLKAVGTLILDDRGEVCAESRTKCDQVVNQVTVRPDLSLDTSGLTIAGAPQMLGPGVSTKALVTWLLQRYFVNQPRVLRFQGSTPGTFVAPHVTLESDGLAVSLGSAAQSLVPFANLTLTTSPGPPTAKPSPPAPQPPGPGSVEPLPTGVDARNYVRAVVQVLPGRGIGSPLNPIVTQVRLVVGKVPGAKREVPEQVGPWVSPPVGKWTAVSVPVAYHKSKPPDKDWPLDDGKDFRTGVQVTVQARTVNVFRSSPPPQPPICRIGVGGLVKAIKPVARTGRLRSGRGLCPTCLMAQDVAHPSQTATTSNGLAKLLHGGSVLMGGVGSPARPRQLLLEARSGALVYLRLGTAFPWPLPLICAGSPPRRPSPHDPRVLVDLVGTDFDGSRLSDLFANDHVSTTLRAAESDGAVPTYGGATRRVAVLTAEMSPKGGPSASFTAVADHLGALRVLGSATVITPSDRYWSSGQEQVGNSDGTVPQNRAPPGAGRRMEAPRVLQSRYRSWRGRGRPDPGLAHGRRESSPHERDRPPERPGGLHSAGEHGAGHVDLLGLGRRSTRGRGQVVGRRSRARWRLQRHGFRTRCTPIGSVLPAVRRSWWASLTPGSPLEAPGRGTHPTPAPVRACTPCPLPPATQRSSPGPSGHRRCSSTRSPQRWTAWACASASAPVARVGPVGPSQGLAVPVACAGSVWRRRGRSSMVARGSR